MKPKLGSGKKFNAMSGKIAPTTKKKNAKKKFQSLAQKMQHPSALQNRKFGAC